MSTLIWIAIGGAAGSVARYMLNAMITRDIGGAFPWGIFSINVAGCFVMGLVAAVLLKVGSLAEPLRLMIAIGFLGGFTTFSAFALDALRLMQSGHLILAAIYVVGSVVLSLVAVFAGLMFMRAVLA